MPWMYYRLRNKDFKMISPTSCSLSLCLSLSLSLSLSVSLSLSLSLSLCLSLSLSVSFCLCPICFRVHTLLFTPGALKLNEHHNGLQRNAAAQSVMNLNPRHFSAEEWRRNFALPWRGCLVDWLVDQMTV